RHVVVDDAERLVGRAHLAAGQAQAFECLRARHLVHEMAVDVDETGAVRLLIHQMVFPDLVVERARHAVMLRNGRGSYGIYRCPLAPRGGEEKGDRWVHCSPTREGASMALRDGRNPWPEPRRSLQADARDGKPRPSGAAWPRQRARQDGRPNRDSASSSAIIGKTTSKADCGATRSTATSALPEPPTGWCGRT